MLYVGVAGRDARPAARRALRPFRGCLRRRPDSHTAGPRRGRKTRMARRGERGARRALPRAGARRRAGRTGLVRADALSSLRARAADWRARARLRLLNEWTESCEGELLPLPMYERCRALLAAGRGLSTRRENGPPSADTSRGNESSLRLTRGVAGCAGPRPCWRRNPPARSESLQSSGSMPPGESGRAWRVSGRAGTDRGAGGPRRARRGKAVTARLRELSEQQQHPWGRATARRCEAVLQLAGGPYDERAADGLAGAAEDYARLGLRFDCARSLLSLGRAERRFKKWGPARESLQRAIRTFEDLGAPGWAQRARSDWIASVRAGPGRAASSRRASERSWSWLRAGGPTRRSPRHSRSRSTPSRSTCRVPHASLGVRSRSRLASRLSMRSERASIGEVSVIEPERRRA